MNNYNISKISKADFILSPMCARLNNNDIDSITINYYMINGKILKLYFTHYGNIDADSVPYFIEESDILFVLFYEKTYALSLKTGQIKMAMELEYALVGVERYTNEVVVITDASIIRIRTDSTSDLCAITNITTIFSTGGFIVDYKTLENGTLKLIHEDSTVTEFQL